MRALDYFNNLKYLFMFPKMSREFTNRNNCCYS